MNILTLFICIQENARGEIISWPAQFFQYQCTLFTAELIPFSVLVRLLQFLKIICLDRINEGLGPFFFNQLNDVLAIELYLWLPPLCSRRTKIILIYVYKSSNLLSIETQNLWYIHIFFNSINFVSNLTNILFFIWFESVPKTHFHFFLKCVFFSKCVPTWLASYMLSVNLDKLVLYQAIHVHISIV